MYYKIQFNIMEFVNLIKFFSQKLPLSVVTTLVVRATAKRLRLNCISIDIKDIKSNIINIGNQILK